MIGGVPRFAKLTLLFKVQRDIGTARDGAISVHVDAKLSATCAHNESACRVAADGSQPS